MPCSYSIDTELEIVLSTASGKLVDAELEDHQLRLSEDPGFEPHFRQLADFTGVTEFEVSAECVRRLARKNIYAEPALRAFAVPQDAGFGLARMFEILRETYGEETIRTFRSLLEARHFLGLAD